MLVLVNFINISSMKKLKIKRSEFNYLINDIYQIAYKNKIGCVEFGLF